MKSTKSNDSTKLSEFRGDEEWKDVTLWFNKEIDLNTHDPCQIGFVGDGSTDEKRVLVLYQEADVPRFDAGKQYRLENVKDHYYEPRDEIQVVVKKYSRVTCLSND